MQKALEVELTDWQRDQEPDIDHEGCYHTSLPTIIAQVLQPGADCPSGAPRLFPVGCWPMWAGPVDKYTLLWGQKVFSQPLIVQVLL